MAIPSARHRGLLWLPRRGALTGKPFMARGGAFRDLDLAMAFHPNTNNSATMGGSTALNSAKFHFKGRTAHVGGDPHNGRSALDAVELMDVGANYLREHVTSDVRIHYTILEGGTAPTSSRIKPACGIMSAPSPGMRWWIAMTVW